MTVHTLFDHSSFATFIFFTTSRSIDSSIPLSRRFDYAGKLARNEIKVLDSAGHLQHISHATIARKVNDRFGLELPDGTHEKIMSISTVRTANKASHPPLPAGPVPKKHIADEDVLDDTMKKRARLEAEVEELEARLEKLQAEFDELQAKAPFFEVGPMQDHDAAASEDRQHEVEFSR